ncbi:hypothetical protein Bbelb_004490 [Branchiostoma belcheri]|nr:hypothetical protein Bbelb_004490 [Branchiostoma belcheri]
MAENIYSEACPVTPPGLAATTTASVANNDTATPGMVNLTVENPEQAEASTDDAATGYIPGVGMRNPGQSRVWTSAVKKTIPVLSLVLNCCLLGVVIFLVVTVLGLKLSVSQLEEKTASRLSDIKLSVSQLEEKTAANLSDIKLSFNQLEEKTASRLSDIKLSVSQLKEKTAANLSDIKLSFNQLEEKTASRLSDIKLSVSQLEEKTAANLSDIKLSFNQLEEKTASRLSDIKLSVSQLEEKTASKLSDIKLSLSISQLNSEHLKLDSSVKILQGKSDALFAALKPFKKWRDDLKCGPGFLTKDGYPAECNPDSSHPCCSRHNWCDVTPEHCDCPGCIDYRKRP